MTLESGQLTIKLLSASPIAPALNGGGDQPVSPLAGPPLIEIYGEVIAASQNSRGAFVMDKVLTLLAGDMPEIGSHIHLPDSHAVRPPVLAIDTEYQHFISRQASLWFALVHLGNLRAGDNLVLWGISPDQPSPTAVMAAEMALRLEAVPYFCADADQLSHNDFQNPDHYDDDHDGFHNWLFWGDQDAPIDPPALKKLGEFAKNADILGSLFIANDDQQAALTASIDSLPRNFRIFKANFTELYRTSPKLFFKLLAKAVDFYSFRPDYESLNARKKEVFRLLGNHGFK